MRVIPAIDLQGGKCVRLFQGDFEQSTEYSDDPLQVARRFAELNVADLHVVDLDGARTGKPTNEAVILAIAAESPFAVQVGGGIRDTRTLLRWLDNGVARCVIGSVAIEDPATVLEWFDEFGPDRIVLALDVTIVDDGVPRVAVHGWTKSTEQVLWDCLDSYREAGLRHVLCTDISRDGALAGPNVDLYAEIVARYPEIELQASGGVRDSSDLEELAARKIPAAITGRALLDGRITAAEVASFRRDA